MNKQVLALCYLLLLSFNALAQPWLENGTKDLMYNKRINRRILLDAPQNAVLNNIQDSTGKIFTIVDIINNAVLKNKVALYGNSNDSLVLTDSLQATKQLTHTYDSANIKQTQSIDNIIIAEDWKIERNSGRITWNFVSFILCRKDQQVSEKNIPIYKLNAATFRAICNPYHVLIDGNKITLTDYFEKKKFESEITRVKTIETTSDERFKRPKEFSEIILTH